MVDAILNDRHMILPSAAHLSGPSGVDGLYVGVPVRLGRSGIEEIVTIELMPEEQAAFDASAASVRDLVTRMAELARPAAG
jgi:malate dehydrogenase